jgi:hypothetical protein
MWAVTARLLVKSHRNRTCRLCQSGKDVPQGVASPLDCESVHPSALRRERAVRAGARSPASQPGWEHAAGSAAFSSSCSFQLSALLPVPPRARSRRQKWPHRSASPKRQPVCAFARAVWIGRGVLTLWGLARGADWRRLFSLGWRELRRRPPSSMCILRYFQARAAEKLCEWSEHTFLVLDRAKKTCWIFGNSGAQANRMIILSAFPVWNSFCKRLKLMLVLLDMQEKW